MKLRSIIIAPCLLAGVAFTFVLLRTLPHREEERRSYARTELIYFALRMAFELEERWELRESRQFDDRYEGMWLSAGTTWNLLEWHGRDSLGRVNELGGVGFLQRCGLVLRLRWRTDESGDEIYADIVSPRARHDALYWSPDLLKTHVTARTFLDRHRSDLKGGAMRPVLTVRLQPGDVGGQIDSLLFDKNWAPWLLTDIYDYHDSQLGRGATIVEGPSIRYGRVRVEPPSRQDRQEDRGGVRNYGQPFAPRGGDAASTCGRFGQSLPSVLNRLPPTKLATKIVFPPFGSDLESRF